MYRIVNHEDLGEHFPFAFHLLGNSSSYFPLRDSATDSCHFEHHFGCPQGKEVGLGMEMGWKVKGQSLTKL